MKIHNVLKFGCIVLLFGQGASAASAETLNNDRIEATFDGKGLVSIHDKKLGRDLRFSADHWKVTVDNDLLDSAEISPKGAVKEPNGMRYTFRDGDVTVEVVYELKPGWRFLTKQLFVTNSKDDN